MPLTHGRLRRFASIARREPPRRRRWGDLGGQGEGRRGAGSRGQGGEMAEAKAQVLIRNIAEVPWRQFPNHFGGALSKPLVMPQTAGSRHLDYRISLYQPMAYVELHAHAVQEQIYHVLEGEGLMEIDGKKQVVRK